MNKSKRFTSLFTALVLVFSTLISTTAFAKVNPDVVGTDYETAVAKLSAVGIMEGYPDGNFLPNGEITRAEFAKIAVVAMGLGDAAEASKGTTKFPDVASTSWAAGYINLAVNKGLVKGYPDGTFKPDGKMTNAEGITILTRMVGLGPVVEKEGTWPANYVGRAANEGILKNVNAPSNTKAIRGMVAKMLVNTLTVELWGANGYKNDGSVEYGKLGTTLLADKLNVTQLKDETVTGYNTDDNELTITGTVNATYEVAANSDIDLYEAYRNETTLWVNDDDQIIFLETTSTSFVDAIEINAANDEVTLIGADKTYDLDLAGSDVNGAGDVAADTTYDLAKVVLNDKNDVVFIDAYTFDAFAITESVKDDVITDVNGDELDLADYTIFKNGGFISASEIVKGDVVLFNASDEIAEVYTKSVTGAIGNIYTQKFEVGSKEFDYAAGLTADVQAMYIDEDGNYVAFNTDAADKMKDEGNVTVFVDREGKTLYVSGTVGTATTNEVAGILSENIISETTFGKDYLEITFINQLGKEVTETVKLADLEKITVDGVDYKVDKDAPAGITADSKIDYFKMTGSVINAYNKANAIIQSAGPANIDILDITDASALKEAMVTFSYNADGKITGLEFYGANAEALTADIDVSADKYAEGEQITADTLVFDITDGLTVDDIKIAKFNALSGVDTIEFAAPGSTVYSNTDNEVVYIVTKNTDKELDETDYTGLLTSYRTNTDGDVVKVTAWVNGVKNTYTVDELGVALTEGKAYTLTVDDATGVVTGMVAATVAADEEVTMSSVSVSNRTFSTDAPADYKLVSGAVILDRTGAVADIEVNAIRDLSQLAAGNQVTIILDEAGTNFVQMVIITDNGVDGGAY